MNYKKSYIPGSGYTKISTAENSMLKMLEFGIIELEEGQSIPFDTADKETAFIMLEGHCDVGFDGGEMGTRRQQKHGIRKQESRVLLHAQGTEADDRSMRPCQNRGMQVACGRKDKASAAAGRPCDTVRARQAAFPERDEFPHRPEQQCQSPDHWRGLCDSGQLGGIPPHKHDEEDMPRESIAEELYYFLFQPSQGFAVQCLYTRDGEIDEAYRVKQAELVEFPRGYHTTVSIPGYETYFLWVMAGEHQGFNRSDDPDHAWVAK